MLIRILIRRKEKELDTLARLDKPSMLQHTWKIRSRETTRSRI